MGGEPATKEPAAPEKSEVITPEEVRDPLIKPEDTGLLVGFDVVKQTCAECHIPGHEGAPIIGQKDQWADRAEKGLDVLTTRAIEGYFGPTYSEMPPRGGNKSLTDEQVRQAVAYMVWATTGVTQ